jgi:predicted aspartyl protease
MALNQSYDFNYDFDPLINVRLFATSTGHSAPARAVIDTGASRTVFDVKLAEELGLDLSDAPTRYLQGIEGTPIAARIFEVELWLLDEPELSLVFPAAFLSDIDETVGNLIGLDVLSQFDLGLQHGLLRGTLGITQR